MRRRPGLYADIPLPVLHVPTGEEGGPGGLPYLMKEEERRRRRRSRRMMIRRRRTGLRHNQIKT